MAETSKKEPPVRVIQSAALSPHSKALYEVGKSLLSDSLESGRDFCKTMIGTSTGAIPLYLGILTFLLPDKFILGFGAGLTVAAPSIGFLIASALFTIGYLPASGNISLDIVEDIERALEKIISYRKRYIYSGMAVFIASTFLAILVIIINIGVK